MELIAVKYDDVFYKKNMRRYSDMFSPALLLYEAARIHGEEVPF